MRIAELSSRPDGSIGAALRFADGEMVHAIFTVTKAGGMLMANPDKPVFERDELDAATVRRVIAAIIAFDEVAEHSDGRKGA